MKRFVLLLPVILSVGCTTTPQATVMDTLFKSRNACQAPVTTTVQGVTLGVPSMPAGAIPVETVPITPVAQVEPQSKHKHKKDWKDCWLLRPFCRKKQPEAVVQPTVQPIIVPAAPQ